MKTTKHKSKKITEYGLALVLTSSVSPEPYIEKVIPLGNGFCKPANYKYHYRMLKQRVKKLTACPTGGNHIYSSKIINIKITEV